jgi:hypothetical protein
VWHSVHFGGKGEGKSDGTAVIAGERAKVQKTRRLKNVNFSQHIKWVEGVYQRRFFKLINFYLHIKSKLNDAAKIRHPEYMACFIYSNFSVRQRQFYGFGTTGFVFFAVLWNRNYFLRFRFRLLKS